MGMGILAGTFGLGLIMRAVSDQRMAWRFHEKLLQWTDGGGTEEKGNGEVPGLMSVMPLLKKGLAFGLAAGVFIDVTAYAAAGTLVQISQRAGGAAGVLACQNGSTPLQVALSLWGHGSLAAGIIAFAGLAAGTATLVCGAFVQRKVSAELDGVWAECHRMLHKGP